MRQNRRWHDQSIFGEVTCLLPITLTAILTIAVFFTLRTFLRYLRRGP